MAKFSNDGSHVIPNDPSYLWATKPDARDFGTGLAFFSDIGLSGSLGYSDAISWKVISNDNGFAPLFINLEEFCPFYGAPTGVNTFVSEYLDYPHNIASSKESQIMGGAPFGAVSAYTFDNSFGINAAGAVPAPAIMVSGVKGSTTLTAVWNTTDYPNILTSDATLQTDDMWAATLTHADGTFGIYGVTAIGASTVTIKPELTKNVSYSSLINFFEARTNPGHLTRQSSWALADFIYKYPTRFAIKSNPIYVWLETQDAAGNTAEGANAWVGVNAASSGGNVYSIASSVFNSTVAIKANTQLLGNGLKCRFRKTSTHPFTLAGHGVRKLIPVTGIAGYVETYIGCSLGTFPFEVRLYADYGLAGQKILYTNANTFGLSCLNIPFPAGLTNVALEVARHTAATGTTTATIGTTTVYANDKAIPKTIIPVNSKGIWLGDSWSFRSEHAIVARLNELAKPIGTTIEVVGLPGAMASWGITNFSKVAAIAPDFVIIEYFQNDTKLTQADFDAYVANIKSLVNLCKGIGARPIVLMPGCGANGDGYLSIADLFANLSNNISSVNADWY